MFDLLVIIFSAAIINNLVVQEIIGADPVLAFLHKMDVAVGLCITMLILLPLVTVCTFLVDNLLLIPLHIEYLRLVIYIAVTLLVIGCIKKWGSRINNRLHAQLNIYLPIAGINVGVVGVLLLNQQMTNGLIWSLAFGLGSAIGFSVILLMLTAGMERLEAADVPQPFRGIPVILLTLALISMAFMGFTGFSSG